MKSATETGPCPKCQTTKNLAIRGWPEHHYNIEKNIIDTWLVECLGCDFTSYEKASSAEEAIQYWNLFTGWQSGLLPVDASLINLTETEYLAYNSNTGLAQFVTGDIETNLLEIKDSHISFPLTSFRSFVSVDAICSFIRHYVDVIFLSGRGNAVIPHAGPCPRCNTTAHLGISKNNTLQHCSKTNISMPYDNDTWLSVLCDQCHFEIDDISRDTSGAVDAWNMYIRWKPSILPRPIIEAPVDGSKIIAIDTKHDFCQVVTWSTPGQNWIVPETKIAYKDSFFDYYVNLEYFLDHLNLMQLQTA